MKRALLMIALSLVAPALAADEAEATCSQVILILDPRLDGKKVELMWGSGTALVEKNAVLALRDCSGEIVDRVPLPGPLARLDAQPVRGAPVTTYLVTVDLTAEAGSYNGPVTQPFEVRGTNLQPVAAHDATGRTELIRLPLTEKAAWTRVLVGDTEDLLSVNCQPADEDFVTTYRRFHPTSEGWQLSARKEKGLWESDRGFPETESFP
jgi:hypothetical protein